MYRPRPIDTSAVKLDAHTEALIENLARNVHEVWAAKRFADGWTCGPQRDDARKEHPCLIPYEQLPDSEKTYDREIVTHTIKALLALGYRIHPPEGRTE